VEREQAAKRTIDWGDLRRTQPIGRHFGFDRGHPVDRHYIERFLDRHRADIRGRVLEIGDRNYTRRFGADAVQRSDIYDLPRNPAATIKGDLGAEANLPAGAFDCMIVPQTLLFIYDVGHALRALRAALAPGGVLLATVPGISQVVRENMQHEGDFWRFTDRSLRALAAAAFDPDRIEVSAHGNVLTCVAFLHGLAQEDLAPGELDVDDPDYPLIVTLRAIA
jgi:hypothetical protein